MPKKKGAGAKKVPLKTARNAMQMTWEGSYRLTLKKMSLTIFPECVFKLSNVAELDLSCNKIQKLPDNIGSFSSLRWLDLHSNKLKSVPESIGSMVGLTHLNLSNNCLNSDGLPSSLGLLCNLKSLNLGLNQLDSLPPTLEQLYHLQELSLFDNLFTKLPDFVKTLGNLTKLNVKRNPLTFAQANSEEMKREKREQEDELFLVHESILCKKCHPYNAEIEDVFRGKNCNYFEEQRKRFQGLMTPNSVAVFTQDVWRIKARSEPTNHHLFDIKNAEK